MDARMRCLACVLPAIVLAVQLACSPSEKMEIRPTSLNIGEVPAGVSDEELRDVMPAEILPQTHFASGRLHEARRRLARAAEQYQLAIGLDPNFIEAHNRLGLVLDQLGRFTEADAAFRQAIALKPDAAYLHNNLGFSYITQRRWVEAESAFRRALELEPNFPRARVNLATALAQQGQYDQALRTYAQAVPKYDAYYNMGMMYQSRRMLVEAAGAFKTALALRPGMLAAEKRLAALPPEAVGQAEANDILLPPAPTMLAEAEPIEHVVVAPPVEDIATPETESDLSTAEPIPTAQLLTGPGFFGPLEEEPCPEPEIEEPVDIAPPEVIESEPIEPDPIESEPDDAPCPDPLDDLDEVFPDDADPDMMVEASPFESSPTKLPEEPYIEPSVPIMVNPFAEVGPSLPGDTTPDPLEPFFVEADVSHDEEVEIPLPRRPRDIDWTRTLTMAVQAHVHPLARVVWKRVDQLLPASWEAVSWEDLAGQFIVPLADAGVMAAAPHQPPSTQPVADTQTEPDPWRLGSPAPEPAMDAAPSSFGPSIESSILPDFDVLRSIDAFGPRFGFESAIEYELQFGPLPTEIHEPREEDMAPFLPDDGETHAAPE